MWLKISIKNLSKYFIISINIKKSCLIKIGFDIIELLAMKNKKKF